MNTKFTGRYAATFSSHRKAFGIPREIGQGKTVPSGSKKDSSEILDLARNDHLPDSQSEGKKINLNL